MPLVALAPADSRLTPPLLACSCMLLLYAKPPRLLLCVVTHTTPSNAPCVCLPWWCLALPHATEIASPMRRRVMTRHNGQAKTRGEGRSVRGNQSDNNKKPQTQHRTPTNDKSTRKHAVYSMRCPKALKGARVLSSASLGLDFFPNPQSPVPTCLFTLPKHTQSQTKGPWTASGMPRLWIEGRSSAGVVVDVQLMPSHTRAGPTPSCIRPTSLYGAINTTRSA